MFGTQDLRGMVPSTEESLFWGLTDLIFRQCLQRVRFLAGPPWVSLMSD